MYKLKNKFQKIVTVCGALVLSLSFIYSTHVFAYDESIPY